MKNILYYTSSNFLDEALETIQTIKNDFIIYLIIEVTPHSKNATILNTADLNNFSLFESPVTFLGTEKFLQISKYFKNVKKVFFFINKSFNSFCLASIRNSYYLHRFIKKNRISILHFDTFTTRILWIIPFIYSKKIILSIHDPIPHTGEDNWKERIGDFFFYKIASNYLFFSNYSRQVFIDKYPEYLSKSSCIRLLPYNTYNQNIINTHDNKNYILFFGRLSYYKGIDILLDTIPKILEFYPDQKFYIIGSKVENYRLNEDTIKTYKKNIILIDHHIKMTDLINYIRNSKFIICPYRESTQSGVLMTTKALKKVVIASNVGSFSEYIKHGKDGFLTIPKSNNLASIVLKALHNNFYKKVESSLYKYKSDTDFMYNSMVLSKLYNSI